MAFFEVRPDLFCAVCDEEMIAGNAPDGFAGVLTCANGCLDDNIGLDIDEFEDSWPLTVMEDDLFEEEDISLIQEYANGLDDEPDGF